MNVRKVIAVDLVVESSRLVISHFNGDWLLDDVNHFLARLRQDAQHLRGLLLGGRSAIAILGQATSCRGGFQGGRQDGAD